MKPKKIPAAIVRRAKKIRLIAMDVDGVLTGGEIINPDTGGEVKFWNVKDGMGFYLVRRCNAGIKLAWITGRKSKQVADRARDMKIDILYQACMSKRATLEEIMQKNGLKPEEVAYIGDDVVDIPVLRIVGLAVSPADGLPEAQEAAHYITSVPGGKGVFREVSDIILKAQGLWRSATEGYI